jgi:UDPglucose 6-dehydrogenase
VAYDPEGMEQARPLLQGVDYAEDAYACAEGADALVIVTEWNAFRALDLARLKAMMAAPVLVDLRNVYSIEEVERCGFRYDSLGTARRK